MHLTQISTMCHPYNRPKRCYLIMDKSLQNVRQDKPFLFQVNYLRKFDQHTVANRNWPSNWPEYIKIAFLSLQREAVLVFPSGSYSWFFRSHLDPPFPSSVCFFLNSAQTDLFTDDSLFCFPLASSG